MGIRQREFQARTEGAAGGNQAAEDGAPIGGSREIRQRKLGVELRRRGHGFDLDGIGGGDDSDSVRGFIGREREIEEGQREIERRVGAGEEAVRRAGSFSEGHAQCGARSDKPHHPARNLWVQPRCGAF